MNRTPLAALAAAFLITMPLAAQSNGATLLAKVKQYNGYNDIWGYTAPNGDEYAIVGTVTGTAFYNCVDPRNPYSVGFISGPSSTWRDMKTWDTYAYIVTEGGGGVQIVDLSNPENPTLVKTWGTQFWSNAHNIAIDTGAGYAYVCGTNNGMRVLNLANPENPTLAATYNNQYVHDLHVQNGQAHLSEIYGGRYRIVNVNNLPSFPTKDSILTPGRFCHNAWANANDTVCVTTDEVNGGSIGVYDISNPNNIQQEAVWTINPDSIIHNVYIRDDWVYSAWYTEGLVVTDISNPSNPSLVASYDTSSYSAGTGFHGAWGCYPFSPSGVVYISDIEEGFYILDVEDKAMDLSHDAPLANTINESGPYSPTVEVQSLLGNNVVNVDLWYRVDGGSWRTTAMTPGGGQNEWSGDIPGQLSPSQVEYYFYATDNQGKNEWLPDTTYPGDDAYSFVVGRIVQEYVNDFEGADSEGWTHGSNYGSDDWERGAPQGKTGLALRHEGTTWYDPDRASSGNNVWANDLGSGASDGAYPASSRNWLQSPVIDCSNANNTKLVFDRWTSIEGAPYDRGRIYVNNQLVWENPLGFTGFFNLMDSSWRQEVIDISSIADNNSSVTVKFELETDEKFEMGGWAIDDFKIVSLNPVGSQDSITLVGPSLAFVNSVVTFDISDAPANETFTMLYSFNLNGFTYQGQNFDLGPPLNVGGTGTTDGLGNGSFTTPPLPAGLSGSTIHIEVGVDTGSAIFDSNVVSMTIS